MPILPKNPTKANSYEIVIIGAGFSGLAAGVRLAHFGKKVLILERHNAPGGLNSFYSIAGRKYDVGLHALTNWIEPGGKKGPLSRLLRQLRFSLNDLELLPQKQSRIQLGERVFVFDNHFATFEASIAKHFPAQIDSFRQMVAALPSFDEALIHPQRETSGRDFLKHYLKDPVLVDGLLCPICFYGSPRENDIDFAQLAVLFRSIFLEGLGRPKGGIRALLRLLTDRYRELGGERKMACGVQKIEAKTNKGVRLYLDNGQMIEAEAVLSSIGAAGTLQLVDEKNALAVPKPTFSFMETQVHYPNQETQGNWEETIVFFSDSERFEYGCPEGLVDKKSGVICLSHNYGDEPIESSEGLLRVTALANPRKWKALSDEDYKKEKVFFTEELIKKAHDVLPKLKSGNRITPLAIDSFTPKTVERYTGHPLGSIYGSPKKWYNGETPFENIRLIGTDQGLLGIVGAMLSGVIGANNLLGADLQQNVK